MKYIKSILNFIWAFFTYAPSYASGVVSYNMIPQVGLTKKGTPFPIPMNQERSTLEYLKHVYDKGVIITESYLRSTIQAPNISTQQLKYGFQSSAPVNPFINTDNSLAQSDTFEVTGMSIALFTTACVAGATTPTAVNFASIAQRQYYPNPNIFDGTTVTTEWENLLAIYNGSLGIKIDTTVYYQNFNMQKFLKVGISEAGTAVSTVAATVGTVGGGVLPFSSGELEQYKVPVVPMFMINGSGKQDIIITLADSTLLGSTNAAAGSVTRLNFIEFTMHGFLCQGGAGQKVNKV